MLAELYSLDEEGKVDLPDNIKPLREIRKIYTRDRDRTKKQAMKELCYIYHMCHWKSPFAIYDEEERHDRLMSYLDLAPGWGEDAEIKAAKDLFVEVAEKNLVSLDALRESRAALQLSSQIIRKLRERIQGFLSDEKLDGETMAECVELLEKIMSLTSKLEGSTQIVKKLEEQVKKEQASGSRIRGGGEKGEFED